MGDQETPEAVFAVVEQKCPEEAVGMEDSSSASMEKEIFGMSTLTLDSCGAYESPCGKWGLCEAEAESNSLNSNSKRASPSSASVLHQPKPKKLFLESSSPSSSKNARNELRRCVSDPCNPPLAQSQSPEHSVSVPIHRDNHLLRRCVSDPCKPPLAPTSSFHSPPTFRRSISNVTPTSTSSPTGANDSEPDCESYVSVEQISVRTFRIHFNCQCGRTCQLLVDGTDYYYKLM